MRIVFANLQYDLAEQLDAKWSDIAAMMNADPMMSPYYNDPVHKGGRGAGGCCFIKDMAAFQQFFSQKNADDTLGIAFFEALKNKNLELLAKSKKDADFIKEVYGLCE